MAEVEVIDGVRRDIIGKKFRRNFDNPSSGHSLAGGSLSIVKPSFSALPNARLPAQFIVHTALDHMLPQAPDLGLSLSEPRDDDSEFRLF